MARRAQVPPSRVGLPDAGKRRTPGLRREEVALLAGVGVSWYTWIEQGRAENVSGEVLDSIARVLMLNDNQRLYLRHLAGVQANYPVPMTTPKAENLQPFVDNWSPNPAYIADHRWNVVIANEAARILLGIRSERYNVLEEFFTSKHVRAAYPAWEQIAPSVVARFRSRAAQHTGDKELQAMVEALASTSPRFAELWEQRDVMEDSCGPEYLTHPATDDLHFTRTALDFTQRIALRMTVYLPVPGTGTEAALRRLSHLTVTPGLDVMEEAR
ncbi:helix-turn-helix transcriptional regulator [Streptomyces sodiiphilus]|uniref:Helix-turn-helix transcriptional regulator n=2 Tax=Streptomyces sodiiphilus TaxID=226217 RepID=A0ABN2P0E6_9ACTN